MSIRGAHRLLTVAVLVTGATVVGMGQAHAVVASGAPASSWYPGPGVEEPERHHHHHPNCNNDPDSRFAMDPYVCPPSHNEGAHWEEHGYPADYYGYGHPRPY